MTDAKTRAERVATEFFWTAPGNSFPPAYFELAKLITAAISAAEEAEREACLAVAELELAEWTNETRMHPPIESIIARIRSRGPVTTAPNDETHEWVAESHSGVGSRFHDEPASGALTYSSPPGKLVATYRRVDAPDALLEASRQTERELRAETRRLAGRANELSAKLGPLLEAARSVCWVWARCGPAEATLTLADSLNRLAAAVARKGE